MSKRSYHFTGIYIHIPFCFKKCPYCAFYKEGWNREKVKQFLAALHQEIQCYGERFPNILIQSIYLGGGTPNSLTVEEIGGVMNRITGQFEMKDDVEVTIELNPALSPHIDFKGLKEAGVNRVSLGVQSFLESELRFLGRNHTVEMTERTIDTLQTNGFENISFDLIFGLPGSSTKTVQASLNKMMAYQPTHLSTYDLTIEPGTPFRRKRQQKASSDESYRQFKQIRRTLQNAGFDHYEVSNFGKPSFYSVHNLNYWNLGAYIGMGPGGTFFF